MVGGGPASDVLDEEVADPDLKPLRSIPPPLGTHKGEALRISREMGRSITTWMLQAYFFGKNHEIESVGGKGGLPRSSINTE